MTLEGEYYLEPYVDELLLQVAILMTLEGEYYIDEKIKALQKSMSQSS